MNYIYYFIISRQSKVQRLILKVNISLNIYLWASFAGGFATCWLRTVNVVVRREFLMRSRREEETGWNNLGNLATVNVRLYTPLNVNQQFSFHDCAFRWCYAIYRRCRPEKMTTNIEFEEYRVKNVILNKGLERNNNFVKILSDCFDSFRCC